MLHRFRSEMTDLEEELIKAVTQDSLMKELRIFSMIPGPQYTNSLIRLRTSTLDRFVRPRHPCTSLREVPCRNDDLLFAYFTTPFRLFFQAGVGLSSDEPHFVKISKKIVVPGVGNMYDYVNFELRQLSLKGSLPTLANLADVSDERRDFEDSQCDDRLDLLAGHVIDCSNMDPTDATEAALTFLRLHNKGPISTLKKKLYLARGQIRTYNVVPSPLLNICGAILQSILQPKNLNVLRQLPMSEEIPPRGKNILSLKFDIKKNDSSVFVATGDLSSFTATCRSAWVALLSLHALLHTRFKEEMHQPRFADTGSSYFQYTLDQVLRFYTYRVSLLTVEYEKQICVILGGILGLKGNMSLTMLVFALEARIVRIETFEALRVQLHFQIGGDDFFVLPLGGGRTNQIAALSLVHTRFSRNMGRLKNLDITECFLDSITVPNHKFCKKSFQVLKVFEKNRFRISVVSLPKIPLMLEHLSLEFPLDSIEYRAFVSGVYDVCKDFPAEDRLTAQGLLLDTYSQVFAAIPEFSFERWCPKDVRPIDLYYMDGLFASAIAQTIIDEVEPVYYPLDYLTFRRKFSQKAKFLNRDIESSLTTCPVRIFGRERLVYCLDREREIYSSNTVFMLSPSPDKDYNYLFAVRAFLQFLTNLKDILPVLRQMVTQITIVPPVNLLLGGNFS